MIAYTNGCQIKLSIPITNGEAVMIARDEASTLEWVAAIKDAMAMGKILQETLVELQIPGKVQIMKVS